MTHLPPPDAVAALDRLLVPVDATSRSNRLYRAVGKPAIDRVAAVVLLVVLTPVIVLVAAAVRVRLGSPVLFRQERLGRDAVPFTICKFRTMRPDRRGARHHGPAGPERRSPIPAADDPRLTRLGRWLSAHSLDELPQLAHVARGQMGLVGPRPDYVHRRPEYVGIEQRRFEVRPGITGAWQVLVGTSTDLHEYAALDVRYLERCSLRNDLRLLTATPRAVRRRSRADETGAHG